MIQLLVDTVERNLDPVDRLLVCRRGGVLSIWLGLNVGVILRWIYSGRQPECHQHVSEKPERPKLQLQHSPVEIERKFLVANNEWKQSAVRSVNIRDGLIAIYKDRKVRVRISGDIATIAVKGPRIGIERPEFEYEIPMADAEGCSRPSVKTIL